MGRGRAGPIRGLLRHIVRRGRRNVWRCIAAIVASCTAAFVTLIYLVSGWIQLSATDVPSSESGSEFELQEAGIPAADGAWRFTLSYGYHRLDSEFFSVRALFLHSLKEIFGAGWCSPFFLFNNKPWTSAEERFVRTINGPLAQMQLTQNALAYYPGDNIRIGGTVQLSPHLLAVARRHQWKPCVAYAMYRVFDQDGHYRAPVQSGMGSFLTPTGRPIESSVYSLQNTLVGSPYGSPVEGLVHLDAGPSAVGKAGTYPINFQAPIPPDAPVGYFRLTFEIGVFVEGGWLRIENWKDYERSIAGKYTAFSNLIMNKATVVQGPLFQIGVARDPRIIWTLLNDSPSSQSRGIVAAEDEDAFALNLTGISQDHIVLAPFDRNGHPMEYDLSPFFPTQRISFGQPLAENYRSTTSASYPPLPLNPHAGRWRLEIRGPDGKTERCDEGDFGNVSSYRATADNLRISFRKYGKYVVSLTGFLTDIYGHRLAGGGHFEVYAALPLSFSSSFKPGQALAVGQSINPRVHVFPPGPTNLRFDTYFYPDSDSTKAIHWTREGLSNPFGYYFPKRQDFPLFDRPGEYRTDVEVWRRDENGAFRYSHFRQVGIVYDPTTVLDLQGFQLFPTLCNGLPEPSAENAFISRTTVVPVADECSNMNFLFFPADGTRLTLLSDTGGQLSVAAPTFTWRAGVEPGFSPTPWSRRATAAGEKSCTAPGCFCEALYGRADRPLLPKWYSEFAESVIYHDSDHPTPIASYTNKGYHPALYPEDVKVKSYCYESAFRPGLTVRRQALEESAMQPYWWIAPSRSPYGTNVRSEGDVENDHYRILASCVRKEYDTGKTFYGYYTHAFGISPRASNQNGYFYSGGAPIAQVAGEKIFRLFGNSPEPGTIFSRNENISFGGFVLPTTPDLPVEMSLEYPDGRGGVLRGTTNRFGEFRLAPVSSRGQPGMLWVRAKAVSVDGVETRVLGTPGDQYLTFVAAARHEKIMLNLRPGDRFRAQERIHVIGRAPGAIVTGKVGYVRVTPGVVLDQDVIPLREDGVFGFSFSLAQDTVKSKSYRFLPAGASSEKSNTKDGKPDGNIQIGIVFVDGRDGAGGNVSASAYFMLKGDRVVAVDADEFRKGDAPSWPLYSDRPFIERWPGEMRRVAAVTDCTNCHGERAVADFRSREWGTSQWTEVMNWHRAKSTGLFWPPADDNEILGAAFPPPAADKERGARARKLIASRCNQCHISWKTVLRNGVRYTRDGWRRYLDYRFPPGRFRSEPAQKYAILRPLVPESCLTCHSARVMQVEPRIEPLSQAERTRLLEALTAEMDGEERLPPDPRGTYSAEEKALYQETCYACHSLELKSVDGNRSIADFVPGHLASKAPGRLTAEQVHKIADYFRRKRQ
jgi:mono/diheme cytochrome c family protein